MRNKRIMAAFLAMALTISLMGCSTAEAQPDESSVSVEEPAESMAASVETVGSEATEEPDIEEPTPEPEPVDDSWKDAYADFLKNGDYSQWLGGLNEPEFFILDIDANGVPELIITEPYDYQNTLVYTYTNEVSLLTTHHRSMAELFVSDSYSGLFIYGDMWGGGEPPRSYYDYLTVSNGEIEYVELSDWNSISKKEATLYPISSTNIQKYIYGSEDPVKGNAEVLNQLPFVGGINPINMSVEQAEEFIKVLNRYKDQAGSGKLIVALTDGGNGIPMLWVGIEALDEWDNKLIGIWQWNGSVAEKIEFTEQSVEYVVVNKEPYIIERFMSMTAEDPSSATAYKLANGQASKTLYSTCESIDIYGEGTPPELTIDGNTEENADKNKVSFWESVAIEGNSLLFVNGMGSIEFEGSFTSANEILGTLKDYVS